MQMLRLIAGQRRERRGPDGNGPENLLAGKIGTLNDRRTDRGTRGRRICCRRAVRRNLVAQRLGHRRDSGRNRKYQPNASRFLTFTHLRDLAR